MADWTAVDPLGLNVTLHDTTWYGHIVRRGNHPELTRHRGDAQNAIASPIRIDPSAQDPACRLYFGAVTGREGLYVKVVVDVALGVVRTAHFVKSLPGGVPLWP